MTSTTETRPAVLVVDDEPEMCWVFKTLFEQNGLDAHVAMSGQEALEMFAAKGFKTALLDAKLPDMDGLDLGRQILQKYPDASLIMVSGYYYIDDIQIDSALKSGVIKAFFSKPFNNEKILEMVRSWCERRVE
ncbi:MAG: response regulator [Myxococcota bacterium]|jgi:DNA-binding NtrC family response regulator